MEERIALIVGATSSLGYSICQQLGEDGWNLVLSARDKEELVFISSDLEIRHSIKTYIIESDISFINFSAQKLIKDSWQKWKKLNAVFILSGDMGNKELPESRNIERTIKINFTAPAQIISEAVSLMNNTGGGNIVVVSSVAGDRGRQSNYIYGSAKSGISQFASGIRNRLNKSKIHVMTVKPGFLDTPMTYGMESPLICDRDDAAEIIISAMKKKKDVIYVPFFWRFIMMIIIHIPEKIFKKLKL